jgi:hypothetical protein
LQVTAGVGLVIILTGLFLPVLWTDSFPIRMLSLSMVLVGFGTGMAGMSISRLLTAGSRAREFISIGGGMIGMAMVVIGLLTLVEVAIPI